MRVTEAAWIASRLSEHRTAISPLLNVGSSTQEFRERRQPHIDGLIFSPLRAAGVTVIHSDLKAAPGVDVSGDLMDADTQRRLRQYRFRAVLSSNLLEHVSDRSAFAATMTALVEPGGLLFVTVPRSYPFHADPIDTGFRPTPDELARLFPRCDLLRGEVVEDTTYARDLVRRGARRAARSLVGALRPVGTAARTQRDSLRWLFRPFTTTCVVLRAQALTPGSVNA